MTEPTKVPERGGAMSEQKAPSHILCQEIIWTSKDKANTYCMRKIGHTGKHNVVNEEPKEESDGAGNGKTS